MKKELALINSGCLEKADVYGWNEVLLTPYYLKEEGWLIGCNTRSIHWLSNIKNLTLPEESTNVVFLLKSDKDCKIIVDKNEKQYPNIPKMLESHFEHTRKETVDFSVDFSSTDQFNINIGKFYRTINRGMNLKYLLPLKGFVWHGMFSGANEYSAVQMSTDTDIGTLNVLITPIIND